MEVIFAVRSVDVIEPDQLAYRVATLIRQMEPALFPPPHCS
jgi:hypothetical protein